MLVPKRIPELFSKQVLWFHCLTSVSASLRGELSEARVLYAVWYLDQVRCAGRITSTSQAGARKAPMESDWNENWRVLKCHNLPCPAGLRRASTEKTFDLNEKMWNQGGILRKLLSSSENIEQLVDLDKYTRCTKSMSLKPYQASSRGQTTCCLPRHPSSSSSHSKAAATRMSTDTILSHRKYWTLDIGTAVCECDK